MSHRVKIIIAVIVLPILIVAAWLTNNFIYPFTSSSPNYADVEKAFAKIQFPTNWQEIKSTENRGLHGRGCDPLNDSGCFSKSITFKVPENTTVEDIEKVLISGGCTGSVKKDITLKGDLKPSTTLECGIGNGISYGSDFKGPEGEVYISAKTF